MQIVLDHYFQPGIKEMRALVQANLPGLITDGNETTQLQFEATPARTQLCQLVESMSYKKPTDGTCLSEAMGQADLSLFQDWSPPSPCGLRRGTPFSFAAEAAGKWVQGWDLNPGPSGYEPDTTVLSINDLRCYTPLTLAFSLVFGW